MTILVTGVAGFIGMQVADRLLADGRAVIGIDNMNDYYAVSLKRDRITRLETAHGKLFTFAELDFADADAVAAALDGHHIDAIIHLGAQAGVRYSLENPQAYVRSNLAGHVTMLELARERRVRHLVYAASSSVYGGNDSLPFRVEDRVDHPVSLYAATKRADELMSETYAHLFRIPMTGLRFFTVYGPWGRPDMALFKFVKAILQGEAIEIYNHGEMRRDFTYVDDLVEGITRLIGLPPAESAGPCDSLSPVAPCRIVNIGNGAPVGLMEFVQAVEAALGMEARKTFLPMQAGDVPATWADATLIEALTGPLPRTDIREGVQRFVN